MQKTSGYGRCPDAGAASQQQIASGDGCVEFTASESMTVRYVAPSNANTGTDSREIKFAIRLQSGLAELWENNLYRTDTPFVAGDAFRIVVESGAVRYSKNVAPFYTSTAAPAYPLLSDASHLGLNGTISNAMIWNGR